ncbi:uncharacterized protein LOC135834631 [Planococcus citri]|uniref:uncharacterized protein LOC135834631 n=1 Tax=Planococcus citri TaxID=170843 RepID=UPI0031F9D8F5
MKLIFIGDSIRTSALVLLCVNVVANIYDLILILMNCNTYEFVKLLGNDVAYNSYLILIETFLIMIAIMLMNKRSSFEATISISIKYWLFGLIVVILSLEILAAASFGILLYSRHAVDKFWKMNKENMRDEHAPVHVYLLVAGLLIGFIAFKLYSAGVLFIYGSNIANHAYCDGDNNDIEQGATSYEGQLNGPLPLPYPPPYDDPPSYSEVLKG